MEGSKNAFEPSAPKVSHLAHSPPGLTYIYTAFYRERKKGRKNEKIPLFFKTFAIIVISSNFAKIYFRELVILGIFAQTNFREFCPNSRNSRKLIFAKINQLKVYLVLAFRPDGEGGQV